MEKTLITQLHKNFEDFVHEENGVEFWMARQLMELLNYAQWSNFEEVIAKAAKSSIASAGLDDLPLFKEFEPRVQCCLPAKRKEDPIRFFFLNDFMDEVSVYREEVYPISKPF